MTAIALAAAYTAVWNTGPPDAVARFLRWMELSSSTTGVRGKVGMVSLKWLRAFTLMYPTFI